jgi:Zn-dependent protease
VADEAHSFCASCGAALPPQALICASCRQLVHAVELEELARQAHIREVSGDETGAMGMWQRALVLLPADSAQAASIRRKLGIPNVVQPPRQLPAGPKPQPEWVKRLGPFGVLAAALLKFKFLLTGLLQFKTLLSMLAFFGVYWSIYGWKFAAGFVIGIYIHEMGHVWMLRHYGLRASAPMFIPGLGAFISMYGSPANVAQDARIGLAGPLWGAGAAIVSLAMAVAYPASAWVAIARTTAYINLFNLTPVWMLDGGRGFRALDRQQRFYLLGLAAVLWYVTDAGLFILLMVGAAYRIFWKKDPAPEPDWGAFLEFAGLMALFAALLALIPMGY